MRSDCHVHLERIGPPHRTPPPRREEFECYVREEGVDLVCGIYESDETLDRFSGIARLLIPVFWERNPTRPAIPSSARGIKIHPFIERFVLNEKSVGATLRVAAARGLPVLVHTDDREPDLSRGKLVGALARVFQEVTLIIGHAGAYAPGRRDAPGESWTRESVVEELVWEAIQVAREETNVFLETSILASRRKAELLVRHAPVEKILIGTDFPIHRDLYGRASFQERALREAGLSEERIGRIHLNALELLSGLVRNGREPGCRHNISR